MVFHEARKNHEALSIYDLYWIILLSFHFLFEIM